jgi:hypothetical protein
MMHKATREGIAEPFLSAGKRNFETAERVGSVPVDEATVLVLMYAHVMHKAQAKPGFHEFHSRLASAHFDDAGRRHVRLF